tara:strand:+ start:1513 stop:1743 length:231 start_codon:yes stop_codon:yes gene_type:complete
MDNPIKTDMNLKVFLTFEDATKYRSYRNDPNPILDGLMKYYASLPNLPSKKQIINVKNQGVTYTVKKVIKRAKYEI